MSGAIPLLPLHVLITCTGKTVILKQKGQLGLAGACGWILPIRFINKLSGRVWTGSVKFGEGPFYVSSVFRCYESLSAALSGRGSNAWVCGRSFAGTVVSNLAGGMDV